ncbi:hypothetical protein ACJIZ3_016893 [Penstemon smallii]|uniref:G3BP-like protein n=1 Tax=Penstemon smallii TaxID=265156 RepID=A0ABD3SUM7_9LAMI
MANQYATAPVAATQVGSYFVQQYYQVFRQQRDYVHQFYNDSSSMMRVDGDVSHSASDKVQIHQLIISLDFTGIEIKTINSLESWNGGVLVVVSGSVKSRDFSVWRKFVQTFFLAPQEKGYFVLNDMFHFADEELVHQPSLPVAQEQSVDFQPTISTHHPDPAVSDYPLDPLEEEAADYIESVHIEGDEQAPEYSYQDHHWEPEPEAEPVSVHVPAPEPEAHILEQESPFEDSSELLQSTVTIVQETQPSAEEPVKLTYASILRAKGKPPPSIRSPTFFAHSTPPVADWNHVSQPLLQQTVQSIPNSSVDNVEESLSLEEGESQSVYVRNLPSSVTTLDILQEFQIFGKIKHDGVFLRNRKDTGVCYAFVEFEDVQSVQSAIKASPIQLAGKQVYIEERRPNNSAPRGGGRGGRGRGGGRGRSFGRGSEQNGSDNYRVRSNGFRT